MKNFSKLIISIVVIMNAAFTVCVLYIFFKIGSEPVALIGAWFAFTTGELWLLATIKKKKIAKDGENDGKLEAKID